MKPQVFILAAATLLGSVSLASATSITTPEVQYYGPAATNWGNSIALNLTRAAVNLSFAGFTGPGTLTGVTISVTEDASGTVTSTNDGTDETYVDAYILNAWMVYLPVSLNSNTFLSGATLTNLGVDDPLPAGGAPGPVHAVSGSSGGLVSSVAGDNLSDFLSPFTISIADKGSIVVTSDNGFGSSTYSDVGKITVSVVYQYDDVPTPEPATLAILGSSLFGLGLIRRRRG